MTSHPEFEEWLGDDDKKRHAFAWFKQRVADLTGTKLDANGDLDEDALTEEEVHGAMAVIQAEIALSGTPESTEMEERYEEALTDEIVEVFFEMPEEQRNEIRALLDPDTPEDEKNVIRRKHLRAMSEDERNEVLQQLSEDEQNIIRRLIRMNDEEDTQE